MGATSHEAIIQLLKNSGPPPKSDEVVGFPTEPYKGLSYFCASDGPIFGQRERQIESCLALLNNSRVLILHGQSGAGKSSFLRAGLLRTLLAGQRFLTLASIDNPQEGYVVRATGDPVYRLRRALAVALAKDQALRHWLTETYASTLLAELEVKPLEEILRGICRALPVPLIIAVDQAEEVLTLADDTITRPGYSGAGGGAFLPTTSDRAKPSASSATGGGELGPKESFFQLVERLCFSDISLKMIVTLRTEYYGQFCDNFRIPPNNALSSLRSGLESYWLSGLHSKEELIEAISIPQREFAKASMHHHHVVSFEIDKDLPQRLVDDLLATKGAASALPILQLVCRELYAAATARAAKDGNQIRLRTADLSKGVAGIVDEYIDQKIRLLGSVSTEKWRGVLASLVGRQEGGVLITLLTPLSDLTKRCQAAGLRAPGDTFRPYLDALCASGVLRSVNYGELKEPEYSLGHDALAPYLYRWHQQQLTERAASERYRRWTIAASVLIVAAAAAFYSLWYVPEKQKVELLVARENAQFLNKVTSAIELASSDSISDASAKLGPALWALAQFSGAPLVHSELHDETRATLSSLLLRSPVASGCVDAIGVQDPLNVGSSAVPQLAFLNEAESCNDGSRDVSRPANVNSLTLYEIGGDKLLNRRRVLTLPSTEGAGNSGTGFPPIPFVGFVKPKNVPVVIADGVIRSANPTGEFTQSSTSDIFGDLKTRFLLFDNSVGALWAMGPTSQDNRSLAMQRADFDNAGDQLKAGAATNVPLSSPIWPVLSPWNDWLADIEQKNSQDSELHVRNRAGGHLSSWNLPSTSWPDPTSFVFLRNQPIRPIGFVRNKSWVAVRTGPNNINLYDVKDRGWAPVQLELPPEAAEDPLRPAWFNRRPTMAGVFSDGVLTLAWATRRGIEVVRWQLPSRKGKATAPLVYSPDPGSTVTDLRFLPSDVLEIVIGEPGTFAVGYRLMDLNRERGEALAHMSDSDLMRVSCSRLKVSRGRSPQIDKVCNSIGG